SLLNMKRMQATFYGLDRLNYLYCRHMGHYSFSVNLSSTKSFNSVKNRRNVQESLHLLSMEQSRSTGMTNLFRLICINHKIIGSRAGPKKCNTCPSGFCKRKI